MPATLRRNESVTEAEPELRKFRYKVRGVGPRALRARLPRPTWSGLRPRPRCAAPPLVASFDLSRGWRSWQPSLRVFPRPPIPGMNPVAHLRRDRHNQREIRPEIDPRLEPFLREIARALWRDVKRQIEHRPPETPAR